MTRRKEAKIPKEQICKVLDANVPSQTQGYDERGNALPPSAIADKELPDGWSWVRVHEVGAVQLGRQRAPKHQNGANMRPYLRVANVFEDRIDLSDVKTMNFTPSEFENFKLKPNDILLNEGQSLHLVGRPALYRDEVPGACFQNTLVRFRPGPRVDPKFALTIFRGYMHTGKFQKIARWTTNIAHLGASRFAEMPFPLPPIDDQRRIVAEIEKQFTRLEAGVAALRRAQANLNRYRAAVLKAACEGRLVPTEAELARAEGRPFESGQQLLARILTERRQNWQGRGKYKEPEGPRASEKGHLPEGWTWATFDQIAERVTVGFVGSMKHEYVEQGVPFLRGQNVRENRFDPDGLRYVSKSFHKKLSKSALRPGDLAVVRSGSVGITCVIPVSLPEANCSDLVLIQRPLAFVSEYGAYFMNSLAKRHVAAGKVGVALIHFNTKSVAALAVPLPPHAEQTRIVAEAERRLSVIERLEAVVNANLKRAIRLRQSILQKAFAGQLVKEQPVKTAPALFLLPTPVAHKPPNRHFARALLSAEIVHRLHAEPTFGRTKHQKIFHLCEHIARIGEIEGQYHREAAGPLDNKLIYANEAELKKQQWYAEVKRDSYGHAYRSLPKAGAHRPYLERYWHEKLPMIEKLIELMRGWKTERCEIFCTAYAAWNDLLIQGNEPTDESILHEILDCWNESKKRITKDRWLNAIHWMKKEGWEPQGFGKPTQRMK